MRSPQAVGIDVGASYSVVAWVNAAGNSEVMVDREGNRLTPSIVLFDDDKYFVGEEARLRGERKEDRIARAAKLSLGKTRLDAPVRGEWLPPEVVHACLLHKLRRDVADRLGEDYAAVVAVPAFFGELRRKAIVDAAEIAGLPLVDVLNEPTAAALAFGEHTGYLSSTGASLRRQRILVFNLNGATFEATLLQIAPGGIETLAVDGDLSLGGNRWDERLADCAAEQFIRKYGIDPRDDPQGRANLAARVERAKHSLSLRPSVHFPVVCGGQALEVNVARDEFARATLDLTERTLEIAERMLATAGLAWPLVDRVLLTGGATQMPLIRQRLREATGREPDHTVHPNEAVARGAALYAQNLLKNRSTHVRSPQLQVTQVATRSLGILGVDPKTGAKINKVLIERGVQLPAQATEKFVIHPERTREVVITVLEGESRDASQCEIVGKAVIKQFPGGLAQEWPVAVTYEYGSNGRLKVDARLCYTECAVHLELTHAAGLTSAQRERWRRVVEKESPFAAFQAELHRKRNTPIAFAASMPAETQEEAIPESDRLLDRARQWLQALKSPATTEDDPDDRTAPEIAR